MSYFQINKAISDLNLATKILQGVPPLLKVCTDSLTEDNNRVFARGYPTEIFFGFFGKQERIKTRQSGVCIYIFSLFTSLIYLYC